MVKKRIAVFTDNPLNKELWKILDRYSDQGVDFLLDPTAIQKMQEVNSLEHTLLNLKMQKGISEGIYHFSKAHRPLTADVMNIVIIPDVGEVRF